jgi:hypothetical protein
MNRSFKGGVFESYGNVLAGPAYRDGAGESGRSDGFGFRCARTP